MGTLDGTLSNEQHDALVRDIMATEKAVGYMGGSTADEQAVRTAPEGVCIIFSTRDGRFLTWRAYRAKYLGSEAGR